jgi:hypothetical protein
MFVAYSRLKLPTKSSITLKPSPGRGWGAFATRKIKQGAMILREDPLFIVRKPHQEITEQDIRVAFQRLKPFEQRQFLLLRDNGGPQFNSMESAFAENSFAIPDSSMPLINRRMIHGLYLLHSRLNHSCVPNAKIPEMPGPSITSYAMKNIAAGEEVTFCYNTDFECRVRQDRHQELRFTCTCQACSIGTPFHELSELRRTLIRGLEYLTLGVDLDGKRQTSTIFDLELKNRAESLTIPLTSRLIYNVLTVLLMQQEGLLDGFLLGRVEPPMLRLVTLFRTASNIQIAQHAMAQKSWLEKFCIVCKLYGCVDDSDRLLPELLVLPGRP